MPTIYDNIEKHLEEGLTNTLETSKRADFCIGYFNLRGWCRVSNYVDKLEGDYLSEDFEDDQKYHCRVMIGMQSLPQESLKEFFSGAVNTSLDNKKAIELKKEIAQEFKDQLIIGNSTNQDEHTLRQFSKQLSFRVSFSIIQTLLIRCLFTNNYSHC